MTQPGIHVQGAKTLRRTLKRAGIDIQDLKAAHKEAADLVKRESEPHAPRRSGRLAASVRTSGTQTQAVIRAGRASVPYAGPIHWGWRRRNIKAQPWLAEAAAAAEPRWTKTYLDAVEAVISKIEGTPGP